MPFIFFLGKSFHKILECIWGNLCPIGQNSIYEVRYCCWTEWPGLQSFLQFMKSWLWRILNFPHTCQDYSVYGHAQRSAHAHITNCVSIHRVLALRTCLHIYSMHPLTLMHVSVNECACLTVALVPISLIKYNTLRRSCWVVISFHHLACCSFLDLTCLLISVYPCSTSDIDPSLAFDPAPVS